MRGDFFDYVPNFKLFIVGNHKPRLSTVDEAIRRRMLIVPFTVQIPSEERDPRLQEKLKAEWPAILRWCIDGCLEWQRVGLAPPAIVRSATDEYFEDQDTIGQWLDDRMILDPNAFSLSTELFISWKTWCESRNIKAGSEKTFVEAGGLCKREETTAAGLKASPRRDGDGCDGFTGYRRHRARRIRP
jgi:putative DNA primase/helicase